MLWPKSCWRRRHRLPPERLRVAHVMAGAAFGGAELFFERLCTAQHAAGEDVLAVVRPDNRRTVRLRDAGVAVV